MTTQIKNYNDAADSVRELRNRLIEISYEIPENAPKEVLDRWTAADTATWDLLKALRANAR